MTEVAFRVILIKNTPTPPRGLPSYLQQGLFGFFDEQGFD
jgi:hypothetical protein